jgi:hypothetical protein
VFAVLYADVRRYGVPDLLVASAWGIHLLQVRTGFFPIDNAVAMGSRRKRVDGDEWRSTSTSLCESG